MEGSEGIETLDFSKMKVRAAGFCAGIRSIGRC